MIYDLITKHELDNIVVAPYATIRFMNTLGQRSLDLPSDGLDARAVFISYAVEGACRLLKRMLDKEDEQADSLMDEPPIIAIGVPQNEYGAIRNYLTVSKEDFEPWVIVDARPHVKAATVGIPQHILNEVRVMIYPLERGETHIGMLKSIVTGLCTFELDITKSNIFVFTPSREISTLSNLCSKILEPADFTIDFTACSIYSDSTRGKGHDAYYHPVSHRWY